MEPRDIFEQFARCLAPRALDPGVVAPMRPLGRSARVLKGQPMRLPAQQDNLVFVASGAIKMIAHTASERDQAISFHHAGAITFVPQGCLHAYRLRALANTQLLVFHLPDLMRAVFPSADLFDGLVRAIARDLGRGHEHEVLLGRRSAAERVAGLLVALASTSGPSEDNAQTLRLPMTRRDIAECLGLTIETVSRELTELRRAGLIETPTRSLVRLLDIARLAERAGQFAIAT